MSTRRLFVFPHAGGSAQYYMTFAKTFVSDVKCVALQYPGRNGSHDLSSFTGVSDLASDVYSMLEPVVKADHTVAFFGHSMGGLLAFEVARRLEEAGIRISGLFVSACSPPGRSPFEHVSASDRGLLQAMSEITGVKAEFLENEDFAAQILPTLRGLRVITDYDCPPGATVSCPLYAYVGDDDAVATPETAALWSERTTSDFALRVFSGHHFYLTEHLPELVADIEAKLLAPAT